VRAYFNNRDATADTPLDDPSYAGRLVLFGHGKCHGARGHCDPSLAERDEYDLRTQHPLRHRKTRYCVDVTRGLRRLAAQGSVDVEVTLVVLDDFDPVSWRVALDALMTMHLKLPSPLPPGGLQLELRFARIPADSCVLRVMSPAARQIAQFDIYGRGPGSEAKGAMALNVRIDSAAIAQHHLQAGDTLEVVVDAIDPADGPPHFDLVGVTSRRL
jgi:hypothetical protein